MRPGEEEKMAGDAEGLFVLVVLGLGPLGLRLLGGGLLLLSASSDGQGLLLGPSQGCFIAPRDQGMGRTHLFHQEEALDRRTSGSELLPALDDEVIVHVSEQ